MEKIRHRIYLISLYMTLYLISFNFLENITRQKYINTTIKIDYSIPFFKAFVIPYYFWFAFMILSVIYFTFYLEKEEFKKVILSLITGMTFFILFSAIIPNEQTLRPDIEIIDIYTKLLDRLYIKDTPTNVFPSIHVYNTICCMVAFNRNINDKICKYLYNAICISICLSTIFIKQHALIDVCGALCLNFLMVKILYKKETPLLP